ncbi:hypothetical protein GQ42DRAFT_15680 [Ramicandelaber brevisporus]|nr:hypothetical protein GQ42DRAFT_15680 [Ramicandelaber brevisporus]
MIDSSPVASATTAAPSSGKLELSSLPERAVDAKGGPNRPSATVIILAPYTQPPSPPSAVTTSTANGGVPYISPYDYRVLLLTRTNHGQHGGLTIFPGGIVEHGDQPEMWRDWFTELSTSNPDLAPQLEEAIADPYFVYKMCAIRETFEESGHLLGIDAGSVHTRDFDDWRQTLLRQGNSGKMQDMFKQEFGVPPALDDLMHVYHWRSPPWYPKKLDTQFFMYIMDNTDSAIARDSQVNGTANEQQQQQQQSAAASEKRTGGLEDNEIVDKCWCDPIQALENFKKGSMKMLPPQWYALQELSHYKKLEDVRKLMTASKQAKPSAPAVETWELVVSDCKRFIYLPGDHFYQTALEMQNRKTAMIMDMIKKAKAKGKSKDEIDDMLKSMMGMSVSSKQKPQQQSNGAAHGPRRDSVLSITEEQPAEGELGLAEQADVALHRVRIEFRGTEFTKMEMTRNISTILSPRDTFTSSAISS